MIVWINGTHGVGKTTTAALLAALLPGSRVFDAEKVGETLMDISPGSYAVAARTWLHADAEVVDTTRLTPAETAERIATAVGG